MSDNPFLDTLKKREELAPSQNYAEHLNTLNTENPFLDTLKKREEDRQNQIKAELKQTLTSVMEKDPDMVGEGLKLAKELNLPKEFALDSEEAIRLLAEKNRKELFSNYIADGKKNWEKNKSHFKGSYIAEDMAICSKLTEDN